MASASSKLYGDKEKGMKSPRIARETEGKVGDEANGAGRPDKVFKKASESAKEGEPHANMSSDKGPKDDKMDGTDKTMAKHEEMKSMHERHRDEHARMSERHAHDMSEMHKAHAKEAKKLHGMHEGSGSEDGPGGGMEDKEIGKGGVEPKE